MWRRFIRRNWQTYRWELATRHLVDQQAICLRSILYNQCNQLIIKLLIIIIINHRSNLNDQKYWLQKNSCVTLRHHFFLVTYTRQISCCKVTVLLLINIDHTTNKYNQDNDQSSHSRSDRDPLMHEIIFLNKAICSAASAWLFHWWMRRERLLCALAKALFFTTNAWLY